MKTSYPQGHVGTCAHHNFGGEGGGTLKKNEESVGVEDAESFKGDEPAQGGSGEDSSAKEADTICALLVAGFILIGSGALFQKVVAVVRRALTDD